MSSEAYVLCDRPLNSISELQAGVKLLGFDLELNSDQDIGSLRGYLPASWRGREAGFEFQTFDFEELSRTYEDIDFGGPWACVYAFYFGTLPSCAGAWITAASCISITGGLAFETHDGLLLNTSQAIRCAHDVEADVDGWEARHPRPRNN